MGANQANCKSETLTMNMAKEVGAVAQRLAFGFEQFTLNCNKKRLGATFVDLHTALMGPNVNLRVALRLKKLNCWI